MVDGDRPKWRAIDRNEQRMLSHREISSRSERLSVCLAQCEYGGRMPPVGEITEKTGRENPVKSASDRTNRLAGLPAIPDLGSLGGRVIVAIKDADVDALKKGMMTMPAHADAAEGLKMLKDTGFGMVRPVAIFASSPQREEPAGERQPRQVFRAADSVSRRHAATSGARSSTTWWPGSSTCPSKNAVWWRHMFGTRSARRARAWRAAFSRGRAMPSCRSQSLAQPNLVAPICRSRTEND